MLDRLLKRPVSVTMVLLVLVVLGIVGIGKLPVSLIPDVDIPYITVQVEDESKSARELDESVVKPLRQTLMQTGYLEEMHSEARDGSASITLDFEQGRNIDYIFIEVNEKVDRAMSSLPKMERPKVFKASATDIPAFYINVTLADGVREADAVSDSLLYPVGEKFREMSDFSRNVITKRIEQLPEVAMVDVSGTSRDEILVVPDEEALKRLGMSVPDFESCLRSANVSLSNLTIRDGEYHYNVKFRSFARTASDIEEVWFKAGDRLLQIKDVADVVVHPAPRSGLAISDGKDAVVLAVIKQNDARMSDLRKSIAELTDAFRQDYPQMEFTVTKDQTELLDYSITNLLLNIIVAILLDCLIIFLFMKDFRSPFLVTLIIPLSLVISFFVFYLIGISINIISLSGLLLGVGMMVDNTIVLTDNITAHWQRGESLRTAVVDGTSEVRGAMLSSVLTTCAVFIPLVFIDGLAGSLFFDQAATITVVLLVSYLLTITVLPVYYWCFYRKLPQFTPSPFLSRLEFKGAAGAYDRIVSWFLGRRWTVWALPLCSAVVMAACITFMHKEKLPPINYTDAVVELDWNEHLNLDENRRRTSALMAEVSDDCVQTTAFVGVQQFILSHGPDQSVSGSSVYFKCPDSRTLESVKARLSSEVALKYPLAVCGFTSSGNIFDMVFSEKEPALLARLRPSEGEGIRLENLQKAVSAIRCALPGVHIDEIPLKTDALYVSDPELMALYGVSFSDLTGILSNSLNGNTVFQIVQGDKTLPVVLGTDVREMDEILSSSFIKVKASDGSEMEIPAGAVMRQTWEQDLRTLVSGQEGDYYPVSIEVPQRDVRKTMTAVENAVRADGTFEPGWSGSYFSNREMIRQMALVLLIAVLLLFLILASQFESVVQPVIILSEVVIDIAASLAALWLFGVSINLMSLIVLVVICGIVVNDSILKVDTINKLIAGGMECTEAIHLAGHRRLKAIIMTSVTTVLAVVPFLSRGNMGDDLQYPMALVIIVGMIVGTCVSLFYVPAVYAAIFRKKR